MRTVSLFLAGVFVFAAAACGPQEEQAQQDEPKTVVETVERTVEVTVEVPVQAGVDNDTAVPGEAPIEPTLTCSIDEECDLGNSTLTVTDAQQTQTINTTFDTFEGNFVLVEFDYTYGGNTPADTNEPPFQLSAGNGNVYSLHFDATSSYGITNDRNLIYETVQPGVTAQGTAIFEVSPDAENFTLLVVDLVSPQANRAAEIPLPF